MLGWVQRPWKEPVRQKDDQHNNVVDHRSPRAGPENPLRVQHRHEQRKEAVEQDLRQQEIGKNRRHRDIDFAVRIQGQLHQPRRPKDGEHGHTN